MGANEEITAYCGTEWFHRYFGEGPRLTIPSFSILPFSPVNEVRSAFYFTEVTCFIKFSITDFVVLWKSRRNGGGESRGVEVFSWELLFVAPSFHEVWGVMRPS